MATTLKEKSGGLAGVIAGDSAICLCRSSDELLAYRGYAIEDLAKYSCFEQTAWLLLRGQLPTHAELENYCSKLVALRQLPDALLNIIEKIPANSHPMEVLRSCCSLLGNFEPEEKNSFTTPDRLIAALPTMLLYWRAFSTGQGRLLLNTNESTVAGYLLHFLHGAETSEKKRRCIDVSLILYAEHEFNASTFTVRTVASTLSDFYSAICGGIGALRGPLHGGANEAALELIQRIHSPANAERIILGMLEKKQLIMGFGHRVYTTADPRSAIIKGWAKALAHTEEEQKLIAIAEKIEEILWEQKQLFPNLDFYSALAYHFCGIPSSFFTPLFAFSRLAGWSAHLLEQRAHNKLIRPISNYIGPEKQPWRQCNACYNNPS